MVRLYRRRIAKVEYWEAWSDAPANCSCTAAAPASVAWPSGSPSPWAAPTSAPHGELHGRAIAWMKEVLAWTGLGDYIGFDDTGDLTIMGEAIDPELAADVLSAELETSGLPTEALIVVSADEDTIHWPPARRGERFDGP